MGNKKVLVSFVFLLSILLRVSAENDNQKAWLVEFAQSEARKWREERLYAESLANILGLPIRQELKDGQVIELQSFQDGQPMYYITQNLNAAKTISTNRVWPNGGYGFSLTGSSETLGIWDAGRVLNTHQELSNRIIYSDGATAVADHSTHVGGTMIATGVQSSAKGMSYQARLRSYDWNNDVSEMASAAASGLKVSNHSYGYITGWRDEDTIWRWWGNVAVSDTEDYNFGFYNSYAQTWDNIAFNAPYYLIVKAAGNDRNEGPPTQPVAHYYRNTTGQWIRDNSTVRKLDGGASGFDCISHMGVAKNILTVGSVNDIPNGYSNPSSVVMTSYSGWGPTDDGRIKPDIVANGEGLYSCIATSNSSYASYYGTSCAVANVSGSVGLLLQTRRNYFGNNPLRASTIKGLIIHTADEAGPYPGPDYMFGWGLMNTLKAVQLMKSDSTAGGNFFIREYTLNNNSSIEFEVFCNGNQPLKATICWTDPPGVPPAPSLNPSTKMLKNDLDLRVIAPNSTTYYPWILDPTSPAHAATTGDNTRDNVEQVYIASPIAGIYRIKITHKGTLTYPSQAVSLILSGINPTSKDVGVLAIETPSGNIDSTGAAITPVVRVKNYGVVSEMFNVTLKIGSVYTNTRSKVLNANEDDTVIFAAWIPKRGNYIVKCSTYLVGDGVRTNDTMSQGITVNVNDVGIVSIDSLIGIIYPGVYRPKATIKNYGTSRASFYTYYQIIDSSLNIVYQDSVFIDTLSVNNKRTISFASYNFTLGRYYQKCSTGLYNDVVIANNVKLESTSVMTIPTWTLKRPMPLGSKGKDVKGGGALTLGIDGKIYAFKGNNTREFYAYIIENDSWIVRESIPDDVINRKRVGKGAALVGNQDSLNPLIFATKGNNTSEFWQYSINNDRWIQKANVPEIAGLKKRVKGGAALAFGKIDSEDYVFLLKGNGTKEFYAYHCRGDSWIKNLAQPPEGPNFKYYKDGSCMTNTLGGILYLLKGGAKTNEFYAYDINNNIWMTKQSLPIYNSQLNKNTKVKDGAAVCFNGDSLIYAIKGGNKADFWQYNINQNQWLELTNVPTNSTKNIGSGAGLVYANHRVYALKGNKTREFWSYTPSSLFPIQRSWLYNTTNSVTHNQKLTSLSITPNPMNRSSKLHLTIIKPAVVKISLYNTSGQLIRTVLNNNLSSGNYSFSIIDNDIKAGVYFIKCQIDSQVYQSKFIIN